MTLNSRYEGELRKGLAHGEGKAWGETDYYEGRFKKGYPHGDGTYTWGNGNIYKGEFVKGEMEGYGKLVIKNAAKIDSVLNGYFKANQYVGIYKEPYRVRSEQGIRKIEFQKRADARNQVSIMVYANGNQIYSGVNISDPNNTMVDVVNRNFVLTNVVYPLKQVDVSFTYDSMSYFLQFEIYEKGSWVVIISV